MPWFPCARQAAGGVLVFDAFWYARAYFCIRRSLVLEPLSIRSTLFPSSMLRSSVTVRVTG